MEDWTEKYRPTSLDDVIGNERAITTLRSWAQSWKSAKIPKKKAVILSGKPGVGKTSCALALASNVGWTAIELNASDARNATTIKRIATTGAINETFDSSGAFLPRSKGGRKLIILDEADNLYERIEKSTSGNDFSDKGGKKAIVETIKLTKQPIILIVNDYYQLTKGSGESLKHLGIHIPFYDISTTHIIELLKLICKKERITADVKLLQTLADRCKGDVRSAVNDLQSLCTNKTQIDIQSLDALGFRNREKIIFDSLRDVFKTRNIKKINESTASVDIAPDLFLLWLTENLPREYIDTADLAQGYQALSQADIFLRRVYRRQYYGFWSYATDIMNGGIATAKTHNYSNMRYYAPTWMKELGKSKPTRITREAIIQKLQPLTHTSASKSKDVILPYVQLMIQRDVSFARKMRQRLNLTEQEIKWLLGKHHLSKLKDIMADNEHKDEKQEEIPIPVFEEKKGEKKSEKPEIKQPSLFDF